MAVSNSMQTALGFSHGETKVLREQPLTYRQSLAEMDCGETAFRAQHEKESELLRRSRPHRCWMIILWLEVTNQSIKIDDFDGLPLNITNFLVRCTRSKSFEQSKNPVCNETLAFQISFSHGTIQIGG